MISFLKDSYFPWLKLSSGHNVRYQVSTNIDKLRLICFYDTSASTDVTWTKLTHLHFPFLCFLSWRTQTDFSFKQFPIEGLNVISKKVSQTITKIHMQIWKTIWIINVLLLPYTVCWNRFQNIFPLHAGLWLKIFYNMCI